MKQPEKSTEKMTNKPLPWPYTAREARDRSAEEALFIVKQLKPLLDCTTFAEADWVRRAAKAILAAETILRHLEKEGAATRPE